MAETAAVAAAFVAGTAVAVAAAVAAAVESVAAVQIAVAEAAVVVQIAVAVAADVAAAASMAVAVGIAAVSPERYRTSPAVRHHRFERDWLQSHRRLPKSSSSCQTNRVERNCDAYEIKL